MLRKYPEGWRCSVAADEVRAFWGRAALTYGALGLAVYLALATAFFALLRQRGAAEVGWGQVVWPGAWQEIPRARARVLNARAAAAFQQGDYRLALLSLSTAVELDPRNYEALLLLTQVAEFQGSYDFAENAFEKLMRDFPAQASRTAIAYHDTLLSLGRAGPLARLCLRMALRDPAQEALWTRSLIMALRLAGRADEFAKANREPVARLSLPAQRLIAAEQLLDRNEYADARALLRQAPAGRPDPVYLEQQIGLAIAMGDTKTATWLSQRFAADLPPLEQALAAYRISMRQGERDFARMDFARAIGQPIGRAAFGRLAAVLIEYPDKEAFRALHRALLGNRNLQDAVSGGEVWVAALACDATEEAAYWRSEAKARLGVDYPAIPAIDFASGDLKSAASPLHLVNTLTLPREVIYSLLQRSGPPKAAGATQPRRP